MIKKALYISLFLLITCSATAAVYKWTDSQGNVHYGNSPDGPNATRVDIAPPPAPNKNLEQQQQQAQENYDSFKEHEAEKAEQTQQAAEMEKYKKDVEKLCETYQKNVENLELWGRRVYTMDSEGGRHYFNDEERQARINDIKEKQAKFCKGVKTNK